MNTSTRTLWPRRLALVGLVLWGVIHVAGGLSLLVTNTVDALNTLGPNASILAPTTPGDAATAVVRFHALNVLFGGLAVTWLAATWWSRNQRWRRDVALGIAAALDVGLVVFLVGPGVLPPDQGLIGPALVTIAVVAVAFDHPWRRTRV